jgi:hypothetical protein
MLSIRHDTYAYMVNGTPITVNHAKSMQFNILSSGKPIQLSSSYLRSENNRTIQIRIPFSSIKI